MVLMFVFSVKLSGLTPNNRYKIIVTVENGVSRQSGITRETSKIIVTDVASKLHQMAPLSNNTIFMPLFMTILNVQLVVFMHFTSKRWVYLLLSMAWEGLSP